MKSVVAVVFLFIIGILSTIVAVEGHRTSNHVAFVTPRQSVTLLPLRGGASVVEEEEDESEEEDEYDSEEEEEEEEENVKAETLVVGKKLASSAVKATEKSQAKKTAEVKKAVSAKMAAAASTATTTTPKKRKKKFLPYIVRACMNPFTVFKMTRAYFASLFNLNYLKEEPTQELRSALEEKAKKSGGTSGKGRRKMKPGQSKSLSDLPQLSA